MRQAPCDSFLTRRREDAKRNHVNRSSGLPLRGFASSREPVSEGDDQRTLRDFCVSVVGLSCGRPASLRCTTNRSNLLPREDFFESLRYRAMPWWRPPTRPPSCSPLFPPAEPGAKLSDASSRVGQAATPAPPGFEGHRQYVMS